MESWLDLNTVNLLGRADSRLDKTHFIKSVTKAYGLGRVKKFYQIREGFEDYNIKLTTARGVYLVKLFSQYKSFRHVKDNIQGLLVFQKKGICVPRLYAQTNGDYLFKYETDDVIALACVMEFFRGKSFWKWKREPAVDEIRYITREMARMNNSCFRPQGVYDVWSVRYVAQEFQKKRKFLSVKDSGLAEKYVRLFSKIDESKLTKGMVHLDLQRSNILTNKAGEIRIIDFSVMDVYWVIAELAVFIALFVWNPINMNKDSVMELYAQVLKTYKEIKSLKKADEETLPIVIGSTYAANCIAASYELKAKGNDNEETRYWVELGSKGMAIVDRMRF